MGKSNFEVGQRVQAARAWNDPTEPHYDINKGDLGTVTWAGTEKNIFDLAVNWDHLEDNWDVDWVKDGVNYGTLHWNDEVEAV